MQGFFQRIFPTKRLIFQSLGLLLCQSRLDENVDERFQSSKEVACSQTTCAIRLAQAFICPCSALVRVNFCPVTILSISELLRSLRHYLRAQSQGHHTIDRLEVRGVERGSARRSSLKGRERAIVSQTTIGTVSKVSLGKLLRVGVERIWAFLSA